MGRKKKQYLTLREVSAMLGIRLCSLHDYVSKRKAPRWDTAKKLVKKAPGTTIDMWMDGKSAELRRILGLKPYKPRV